MKAEKTKSKRMIFPILLAILMVISIGIVKIYAEISKECPDSNCYDYCNNCHIDANAGTTIKDCIGCHSSSESSTYYDLGGYLVPVVNYTGPDAPVNYLAGGNFWWVNEENSDADDSKGHNIFFKQNDNELSKAPGGLTCSSNSCHENFDREYAGSDHGLYGRQGCTGCHMVDDLFQPSGYHHADDGNQYDIINRFPWYRFLKSHLRQGGIGGVIGIEDPKWQSNNESDPEHHNEYLGKAGGFTFDSWSLANQSTITAFCSGCHGKFHIQHNDPNGHWIRHPSDAIIPNTGEYKVYTIYNTLAPVARQNLNSISPDVTPGEDLVSCISCHRPHGSPYPDMLRWDPNTCEGCFICHSDKSLVNGPCNKCHTMHHSQDGVDPFIYFDPERDVSTGPQNALLFGIAGHPNKNNSICIVCHSGSSSVINGCDTFTKAPQIDLTGDAMLAGGTFATTDAKKHNVLGLALPDASFGIPNIPPGGSNDDIGGADQITCAGTTGCHGNRAEPDNLAAVYGAHHANERDPLESGPLDGTTVGKSYRFLSKDGVDVVFNNSGVLGLEHSDWEYNRYDTKSTITSLNASEHNVYDAEGINKLCASCHGDFHGADNPGGPIEPWLRHPTDITLDAAAASGSNENTDYPGKNDDLNNYSTKAPVGYNAYFSNNQIGTAVAKSQ